DAREAAIHRLAPDRIVDRARHDAVERRGDALVFRGIDRVFGPDIRVALAVAVGVDDERGPSLRGDAVLGLAEFLDIEPADDAAAGARTARAHPKRVVGVMSEIKMMRREAGVDHVPLAGRGIK